MLYELTELSPRGWVSTNLYLLRQWSDYYQLRACNQICFLCKDDNT